MTQPVGSVLGTHPISRTWLRSSPILCIVDGLAFILQIISHHFVDHLPWRRAFRFATENRFEGVEGSEAIEESGRTFALRWLLFLIGTHASFLKLVGAEGLPGTKMLGVCFAVSFVFFEVVLYAFPKRKVDSEIVPPVLLRKRSGWAVTSGFWIGCSAQSYLFLWTFWQLVGIDTSFKIPPPQTPIQIASPKVYRFATVALRSVAFFFLLGVFLIHWVMEGLRSFIYFTILGLVLSTMSLYDHLVVLEPDDEKDTLVLFISAAIVNVGIWAHLELWSWLATRWPAVAERLLILDTKTAQMIQKKELDTKRNSMEWLRDRTWLHAMPLSMFLANVALCVLWYRYCYNAEGTSYQDWTDGMS